MKTAIKATPLQVFIDSDSDYVKFRTMLTQAEYKFTETYTNYDGVYGVEFSIEDMNKTQADNMLTRFLHIA